MEFLVIVIAFILLILVVVWAHFINQNRQQMVVDNSFRDQTNVRLYHEHKAEIEKDFQQGRMDDESYQYLIAELEQSLLQDIEDNTNEANAVAAIEAKPSLIWPMTLSLFLIGFSGYFYAQHGAFELVANTPKADARQQTQAVDSQQQAIDNIKQLQMLTEKEPENSKAWYSLGQALVGVGGFDGALKAFDRVIKIDGEHADLYGAKAQASYYQNKQKITPQVQQFIDKALTLDAKDPSTNILLGMDLFMNKQYQQAISRWQMVIEDNRPNVNINALKGAITEAKNRLALSGGVSNQTAATNGPQLSLTVSVSDDILAELEKGQDKIVFIYATATQGSRMPLAALKVKASDLPLDVVLNDASAMTPQAKLSDVEQVNLYAIISADGGVGIKPGDFKAELKNISVSETRSIALVVNSLVE